MEVKLRIILDERGGFQSGTTAPSFQIAIMAVHKVACRHAIPTIGMRKMVYSVYW